jgi:gas vesicle protein
MSNTLNNTMDAAKDLMDSAKSGTQHAASSARSALFDGIHALSSVVSMVRDLQMSDALGWVGLQRRRSSLLPFALFGAGIVVGAGVGMLIAPRSGQKTRRAIFDALKGVEEKVEAEAKDLEQKAEKVVGKVENKVMEKASDAKETIKTKAEEAAGAVKGTMDDAKAAFSSMDPHRNNVEDKLGTNKPMTGNHRVS